MSSKILAPFHLLELNVISAQDLYPVSRSMRTYAIAWVHSDRRLSTRVDANGRDNPTWNDKFVFRVDEEFLRNEMSAVMIEIYALHWFRDIHVGTVRVLVGNLVSSHRQPNHMQLGMRFVALQVRRPSGRPQGILNIGLALLDSSMRSLPLYTQLSSAVGYRHLMGEEDPFQNNPNTGAASNNQNSFSFPDGKPELRRTKSDSSSMPGSDLAKKTRGRLAKGGSLVGGSLVELVNETKKNIKGVPNMGESGSVVSGSDVIPIKGKNGKESLLGSAVGVADPVKKNKPVKPAGSAVSGSDSSDLPKKFAPRPKKHPGSPFKTPPAPNKYKTFEGATTLSESELGPSASEVAAAKAKEKLLKMYDEDSSGNSGWEIESSVEGLQSKLARWRMELPPLYESSFPSSTTGIGGGKSTGRHSRRHTDGGNSPGLFSCFGKMCGCECSIVCGSGPTKKTKKKGNNGRSPWSTSNNNTSFF